MCQQATSRASPSSTTQHVKARGPRVEARRMYGPQTDMVR